MTSTRTSRSRACTPRSTTGCSTCRRRKVKCGEEKPACQRCRTSGWNCPGYSRSSQPDDTTTLCYSLLEHHGSTSGSSGAFHYALPFKIPGGRDERRALHYFNSFAAPDMSGPFPSNFWSRTVLQRCQTNAPLRHAAAVLGQIHVEYIATSNGTDFSPTKAVMQTYGRAIGSLRTYIDNHKSPDCAMVLTCSAIFFCFELIKGGRNAAFAHLQRGLQVLLNWQGSPEKLGHNSPDEYNELLDVFARMDLEASLIDDGRPPALGVLLVDLEDTSSHSLRELHRSLFLLLHAGLGFLVDSIPYKRVEVCHVPCAVLDQRRHLLDKLRNWDAEADSLEQRLAAQTPDHELDLSSRKTIATCRLHSGILSLLLRYMVHDDIKAATPSWDNEAEKLLLLAETALLPSADAQQRSPPANRRFSPHTAVVAPLFMLAVKVSQPGLRQSALKLLSESNGCREGFYDAAAMVESVATLEERANSLGLHTDDIALECMSCDFELLGSE